MAALEIMGMNLRIEDIILNGESEGKSYYEVIQDGEALGAGEDGDIDAAGVQAGGTDRAVDTRADHENLGLVVFHVSQTSP